MAGRLGKQSDGLNLLFPNQVADSCHKASARIPKLSIYSPFDERSPFFVVGLWRANCFSRRHFFGMMTRFARRPVSVGTTWVIFDGDKDRYAYAYMRGWTVNDRVEFDFRDAHDVGTITDRAQAEAYVKSELRKRMEASNQALVLVGESTKNLRKFVG
jgi:hypothetical protein